MISLRCCHPLEYDLGSVLYVVSNFNMVAASQSGTIFLSFQNVSLPWLQRRIAVAFVNVLGVVKAAPQARPKTT